MVEAYLVYAAMEERRVWMTAVAIAGARNGLDRLEAKMAGRPMPEGDGEEEPLSPEEAQALADEIAGRDVLDLPTNLL